MGKPLFRMVLALVLGALPPATLAQFDSNGPNARLTLQGVMPSSDPSHDVIVPVPGLVEIRVDSGANTGQGILLLASLFDPVGPQILVPWGGSIDLGQALPTGGITDILLVCDGVGQTVNPVFDLLCVTDEAGQYYSASSVPGALGGFRIALQAIVEDPTSVPFGFDNTEVGDANFSTFVSTLYTLADDGSVLHPLTAPIHYGGVTYNQVWLNANGYVTFFSPSNDFTETMVEFFGGWGVSPNPGVALVYSDLNQGGLASGATYEVREDSALGRARIIYANQIWWQSVEPAGTFAVEFGAVAPGSVSLDYTAFTTATMNGDSWILGVTDGDPFVGANTNLSNGAGGGMVGAMGSYVGPGTRDSIGELVPPNVPFPPVVFTFLSSGPFIWTF